MSTSVYSIRHSDQLLSTGLSREWDIHLPGRGLPGCIWQSTFCTSHVQDAAGGVLDSTDFPSLGPSALHQQAPLKAQAEQAAQPSGQSSGLPALHEVEQECVQAAKAALQVQLVEDAARCQALELPRLGSA